MATQFKMNDAELASLVERKVRDSSGLWDGKLSAERANVGRYYDGLEPKPQHAGDSKYVSQDVFDGVEGMRAQLLETFAGTQTPISFAPQGVEDEDMAVDATEYVSYAIYRQNPGYAILRDVIHDGLTSRVGVAKVWWDANEDEEETEVEDVSYADFEAMLAQDPEIELTDLDLDSDSQMVRKATMVKKRDTSQVRIELVPPEEFGITKRARSAEDADVVYHRRPVTADALRRMGVSEALLKSLKDDERFWEETSPENIERHQETDDTLPSWPARDSKDSTREIDTTEAFCKLDLDGRPAMWRLLVAGGKLLLKEKVRRRPFVYFTPLPRPHSFWGSNYAKKLIPTQNARTLLTRSIINHALITNNPRTGVVKGGVVNPKELTENRLGGIVNLSRPDALVPIVQTGLNPFVFQTIALLDEDKEETTGLSKLSQGLNKDAISKQNSADMVQSLVGLSQTRQKITARNFAEGFLKELFLEVYRLIIENETTSRIIEVAGSWKPVDPTNWPDRKDVIAEVSVGFGEQDVEVKKWMAVDAYLGGDPRFKSQYTPDRRYNVVVKALRAGGIRNVDSIFANPRDAKPDEPDPMQQAELAEVQARAKQADAQAQSTVGKLDIENRKLEQEAQMRQLEMQHEVRMAEMKEREMRLKLEAATVQHEQKMAMFQMELAAAQQADKTTGVLSPDA